MSAYTMSRKHGFFQRLFGKKLPDMNVNRTALTRLTGFDDALNTNILLQWLLEVRVRQILGRVTRDCLRNDHGNSRRLVRLA